VLIDALDRWTFLFITHNNEIANSADNIIKISDGKITS